MSALPFIKDCRTGRRSWASVKHCLAFRKEESRKIVDQVLCRSRGAARHDSARVFDDGYEGRTQIAGLSPAQGCYSLRVRLSQSKDGTASE